MSDKFQPSEQDFLEKEEFLSEEDKEKEDRGLVFLNIVMEWVIFLILFLIFLYFLLKLS